MKLQDLYSKSINRAVNPAVSATKFDDETKRIEIQEYVFTDEIINGLVRILDAIKNNKPFDHVGIWIDGYYGSGKSHFLKYLDYCITKDTQEEALQRLIDAVSAIDPMDSKHSLDSRAEKSNIISIANWLKSATIDTCIFNLETSYNNSMDKKTAFLHVFWNEFNGKRGFNKFNIFLAQHLEKPLAQKGVFDKFKQAIKEIGGNWENPSEAADIVDNELGAVLDIAKAIAPTLDIDSIRERIVKRDSVISIDKFAEELKSYLQNKDENYRLIMLADEVSQFINKERDRYLNLQEIITKLSEACDNKIWVACTAQQDLSEIMDDCNVNEERDSEGKIKGRFEVKVSLKGTQPEVITQKRILDKKNEVRDTLKKMYDDKKNAYDLQFKLPSGFSAYNDADDFINFYPFVPYQFRLIMKVFDSFLNLGYVAREVKGNERSIIKVVHATAKNSADSPVGKFISFDELYNNMFEEGLQARGQKAIDNAVRIAKTYSNPDFAKRVVNVLFMICNIAKNDQLQFPANLENITTLLVNDVETPRLKIKGEVEKVVEFLCDSNIIRREQGQNGNSEFYSFYSEEQMKVAELIKNQPLDNDTQANMLKDIFLKYIKVKPKEQYVTRSFSVGVSIKNRTFLSNNPDVTVEFLMDYEGYPAGDKALRNESTRMIYYIGEQFSKDTHLRNNFHWYCKVNAYLATPATSEENQNTRKDFEKDANKTYEQIIEPSFRKILDTCPIIYGQYVIDEVELGSKRGDDRYTFAIQKLLSSIYSKAKLVDSTSIPRNTETLKNAILRPIVVGEYDQGDSSMTTAENEIETYLSRQYGEYNVADLVSKYAKAPFGWASECTLYIINELVRRHKREYSYGNNPNVETQTVANRIVAETNKFTLKAAAAISPDVINNFIDAWKFIFGPSAAFSTNDSSVLFKQSRAKEFPLGLENIIAKYEKEARDNSKYSFVAPLNDTVDLFRSWIEIKDPLKYFNEVITNKQKAHDLIDTCKAVVEFIHDQKDKYQDVVSFVINNRDNFEYLDDELRVAVDQISDIENQSWPIDIRSVIKIKNQLNGAIDAKRKDLRMQIMEAYSATIAQLEKACEDAGVDKDLISQKDAVILAKTSSDSIAVLKNNLDTSSFFNDQSKRIRSAMQKTPDYKPTSPNESGNTSVEQPSKSPVTVNLNTRTVFPLITEANVDEYLANLRKQIMAEISKGNSVMIIK